MKTSENKAKVESKKAEGRSKKLEDGKTDNRDGRMENGDGRMENEEGKTDNGDGKTDNGDGRMENEDGRMENEDGKTENEDGRMENEDGRMENEEPGGEANEEEKKRPVVSVLITVKNTEKEWLEKALHSVLSQDFEEEFEIVLIDDASEYEYSAWLAALAFENEKIILLRKSISTGRGPALNEGIALCGGEFIGKMDSDDIAEPNWLREMVAFMREHEDAVVAGCQIKFFGEQNGRVTNHPLLQTSQNVLNYPKGYFWVINHPGCMFRTKALAELGGYGEFLEYTEEVSEDFDLWCRILKAGHPIYTNQKVLINYRYVSKPERYSKVWYEFLEGRKAKLKG